LRERYDIEERQVFGTVRDPLSWLWSWYEYILRGAVPEQLRALAAVGRGSRDFDAVVEGACYPHDGWPDNPLIMVPLVDGGRPPGASSLWSWAVQYFYAEPDRDVWCVDALVNQQRVRAGLAVLGLDDTLEPKNVAPPSTRRTSDYTRDVVAQADGPLAAALGYPDVWTLRLTGRGTIWSTP